MERAIQDIHARLKNRTTIMQVRAFWTRSSSRQSDEFLHICLASGQQRGDDLTAVLGQLVAVAALDFFDEAVVYFPSPFSTLISWRMAGESTLFFL